MKIEHVAMYVEELEAEKQFFVKYFGAESNDGYYNPNTGFRSYFLTFEDGCRLEIMNKAGLEITDNSIGRFGLIHIAFSVGSKEKVDRLTADLKRDGYRIISGPCTTGDGYYESCILDPEGNQIEITE